MLIKSFFLMLSFMITSLTQSAAHDLPNAPVESASSIDLFEAIVGIECSSRGSFALGSEINIDTPKAKFILAYSEHPDITDTELSSIVHNIAQASDTFEENNGKLKALLFEILCAKELANVLPQKLTTHDATPEIETSASTKKTSHDLITLYLTLDNENLSTMHWGNEWKEANYRRANIWDESILLTGQPTHVMITTGIPYVYTSGIENVKHDAERRQQQNPERPFHAIVNIAEWRNIVGETLQEKTTHTAAATPASIHKKKKRCILQ